MMSDIERYKAFVDRLAEATKSSGMRLEELGRIGDKPGRLARSLQRLDPDDRRRVEGLLEHAYTTGGIQLLEALETLQVGLPVEPFGEPLAVDWLHRREGKPWPDELRCPVHDEAVQIESVPIRYGLFRIPDGYIEGLESRFPLASTFVMGGCVVEEKKERVQPYCVSCRRAFAAWCRERGERFGLPRDVEGFMKKYGE